MIASLLGSTLGKGLMVAVALGAVGVAAKCTVDAIKDSERARIENQFNKDRVEDLKKRLGTDDAVKELGRRQKVWCAAGLRECCAAGAGKLLQCTKDPAE